MIIESKSEKLVLDTSNGMLEKEGVEILLTVEEFKVLKVFLENKNMLISKEDFIDMGHVIKTLRRKLNTEAIVTISGMGYQWNEKKANI